MADSLVVDIVAPTGSIFHGEVDRFKAPGVVGSFEILKDHAPMLVETGIGVVTLTIPGGERIMFATSPGFVQVAKNQAIMLVDSAEPSSEIDVERAKAAEERARQRLQESGSDRVRAAAALERARNRLRLAMGQVGN